MPATTVTLKQIASDLAEKNGMTKKDANILMDGMVESFVKYLKKGNRIRISGIGTLEVRKMKARTGRNPQTGEQMKIPARKKVAFRVSKDLKDAI